MDEFTYKTNLGGFSMLAYLIMSLSGSMFAQAYRFDCLLGLIITMERPSAVTSPSSGKFESVNTFLCRPMSMVPRRADRSPTWHRRGFSGPHSWRYRSCCKMCRIFIIFEIAAKDLECTRFSLVFTSF